MDRLDFTKRLLSYSAAGAAAALTGGSAQAAIIANTTPQNFDVRIGSFVSINFDGAGIAEFRIEGSQSSSSSSFFGRVRLYQAGSFAHFEDGNAANGGGNYDPNALPIGFFIGPGGIFDTEIDDTIANTSSFSATSTGGNFPGFTGQVRYVGTRFNLGGNTHYGWIGINLDSNLLSGVVTGYAFEACADQGINAGATTGGASCGGGSAVPEPSSLALLATGAAGLFALRRRRTA